MHHKERNDKNLTEAEEIKKRCQEYTEKILLTQRSWSHSPRAKGEVKWALGSITTNKASGGDGIPAELF